MSAPSSERPAPPNPRPRGLFGSGSLTLFRVRSVPIRAHWSLLLVLPYFAVIFSLHFGEVARTSGVSPGTTAIPPVVWGLLVALGLFASVAIHELAHTLVALRTGGRVRAITLMALGGVSQVERMPSRPRQEALMAAAGPAMSLVLGGLLLALERVVGLPDARIGLFYLGRLNLALAAFNLLPAFPMDGGRVLRALLAGRYGMLRATRVAAGIGRVAAILFALIGAVGGSILLVLIGIFLFTGAGYEQREGEVREVLGHLSVREVMASPAPTVPLEASIAEALDRMRRAARLDLLVLDALGRPRGVVQAADLSGFDAAEREAVPLRALGDRIAPRLILARPDEPASAALERAREAGAAYIAVIEPTLEGGAGAVGLVGPTELEHAFTLHSEAARPARFRPRPA